MQISNWLPIALAIASIPLSLFMWLGNVAIYKLWGRYNEGSTIIPPTRWLFSLLAPILMVIIALRRKSISNSGAILGVIFAFILSISNYAFFTSLAAFFFSSSRATKYKSYQKRKFEQDFKEGEGQRTWLQVLCNGGMATQLAILYLIDVGNSEMPIDFEKDYRSSWLSVAVLSSFACCNGDTWASELGCVLSKRSPVLITTFKRVPCGTNGGISIEGSIASFLGGLFVGFVYYLTIRYTVPYNLFMASPAQWPLIVIGGIAGLFGSCIDSLLGATLQYSAINNSGRIVDSKSADARHISGLKVLDNHSVNLISSIITAVSIPVFALKIWPTH